MGFLACNGAAPLHTELPPNHPCLFAQAPAVSLAEHADALAEEMEGDAMQLSTKDLGCQRKNASRQYQRIVKANGLALMLSWVSKVFTDVLLETHFT